MKTFKILNHTISFDEDLANYKDIMNKAIDYRTNFLIRYLGLELIELKSYSDFFVFQEYMYNYFIEEVSNLTKSILQIYVDYKIYDMTSELIQQRNSDKITSAQKVFNTMNYFAKNLYNAVAEEKSSIQESTANNVNEAIQGHYFDVYSPYYSDIVMNEWFNNREKNRVEKKREQLYKQEVSKSFNQLDERFLTRAKFEQKKYYKEIRQCIENLIPPMYEDCIKDLATRGKISNGIYENLQTSKALAINENINLIKNKDELEQQLILALQLDPCICETHIKIIEYISDDDMQEYIELIKFLKLAEYEIFKIYLNDNNNSKCLSILKKLTNSINIDRIVGGLLCRNEFTLEGLQIDIKYTEQCFKTIKDIFGVENSYINQIEQDFFELLIKRISSGTNLVYDRSISRLDYNYLYEFWDKARKQHNATIERQEIIQDISNSFANWIKNHIKGIIIFIIILAIFYFASKDSDDTKTKNSSTNFVQNTQAIENKKDDTYYYTMPNYDSDTTINEDDLFDYKKNSEYVPGKSNPFAAY